MAWKTSLEIQFHLKRNTFHMLGKTYQNREATDDDLQKLVAQVFVLNVAYRDNKNYVALTGDSVTHVHPG